MKKNQSLSIIRYQRNGREIVRFKLPQGTLATEIDLSQVRDPRDLSDFMDYKLTELLGQIGMAYNTIAQVTGLSPGTIAGRLNRSQVKVRAYRNGESPLAKELIGRAIVAAQDRLIRDNQKVMLHPNAQMNAQVKRLGL